MQVITQKGDAASLAKANRSIKDRIATNEKTFVCNCVKPQPELCRAVM